MKTNEYSQEIQQAIYEYVLHLGDDQLVMGHRLSEWCGHGPVLEEDIALANIALDCLGQAAHLLTLAGEIEDNGRSEDDFAYLRDARDFRNALLTELPKGDFAFTIVRQFLFDSYCFFVYQELQKSLCEDLAAIAAKSFKEIIYHLRHSSEWILRLGDGTEESHQRAQNAIDDLWIYTGDLFSATKSDQLLVTENIIPDIPSVKSKWQQMVNEVISESTLTLPEDNYFITGSREGKHTEYLGHMLAEMQILARSHPGAKW